MRPGEEQQSECDEERGLNVQKPANAIDALIDHEHVDTPKEKKTKELRNGDTQDCGLASGDERRDEYAENFVNGVAADPGLGAEPTARDEGAHEGGHVCAFGAECGPAIDRKGNAIKGAGMGVKDHRDEDDEVAEKDGEDRLPPI